MGKDIYPSVLLFRYDRYKEIDAHLADPKLKCELHITNKISDLWGIYNGKYHVLVTYGPNEQEYIRDIRSVVSKRQCAQWIHHNKLVPSDQFEYNVTHCYISNVVGDREACRPTFSAFTTCFNSFEKIKRPYNSLLAQTEKDWEWVILDDSTDETHFAHLKRMFRDEPRVRLYNRSRNSGSIGNVKNEAVSLCRGKYVLELDHDDVILPNLVKDAVGAFQKYPEVGFVYMDCCNMHEDGKQFSWGDFCCLGYGAYYYQKHDGIWMSVMCTPQINNMTMSHLVAMPNHPRIWKRDLLNQIGNYSEMLPICDDLEVLLRTCYNTKMLKIPKLAYIQIFNDGGNNFSWIRNAEINRLGPQYIAPMSARQNNSDEFFKSIGAWDEKTPQRIQLWKRDVAPPYANILYHPDYDTQIGIIGLKAFEMNMERIKELYADPRNDFILLESKGVKEDIIALIEKAGLDRMKFYILADADDETLVKYFHWVYRGVDGAIIFDDKHASKAANTALTLKDSRGQVFNHLLIELPEQELAEQHITADCVVLELGARYGSVSCIINRKLADPRNQVSVEPAADIWDALERNRDENGCSFHILKGAISKEPLKLIQSGYATRSVATSSATSGATSATEVPIYTLDEVEAKYGLKFNTLVADCEGFLGKFLDENPRVYEDFTLFMFERDFPQFCNYDKIIQKLREHGFVNLFSSLHEVWQKGSVEPKGSTQPLPKI